MNIYLWCLTAPRLLVICFPRDLWNSLLPSEFSDSVDKFVSNDVVQFEPKPIESLSSDSNDRGRYTCLDGRDFPWKIISCNVDLKLYNFN